MANSRIRRYPSEAEYERAIDDFITSGYKVVSRGEKSAHLEKRGAHDKHLLVFLVAGWWTIGIANLIYALLPAPVEDDVTLKVE